MMKILPSTAAAAPTPTLAEVDGSRVPRFLLWVVAIYLSGGFVLTAAALCYLMWNDDGWASSVRRVAPWGVPAALMLWGIYMALLAAVMMHMVMFLPRAPRAVCAALVDVGATRVGMPLGYAAIVVACMGPTWIAVALVCVFLVLIADVLALWMWLVRTYGHI